MRAGGIKLLAHRRGRASLAVAVRPPLIQKEVTLETVTPHFEILETGEIDETVFSKSNVKKRPGTKCVLRGGPVKSPETSETKLEKMAKAVDVSYAKGYAGSGTFTITGAKR